MNTNTAQGRTRRRGALSRRVGLRFLTLLLCLVPGVAATAGELRFPASFVGLLPCADCAGIAWHLDLWPDGRYHLQRSYEGRAGRDAELGRWRSNPADDSLLLFGDREAPLRLARLDDGDLRLLDTAGKVIESSLPYELQRLDEFAPIELSLPLWGEFEYLADAASLRECRTDYRYPVLMEGAYRDLEQAYSASRRAGSTEPFLVHVEGSIVNRQVHAGEGPAQSLAVERFISDVPGLRCERAMSSATLPNTYWRVLKLGATPLERREGVREVHFVLHDSDGSIAGFAGCNRFRGAYTVDGDTLTFGPLAATRMACPEAQMALEGAMHESLGSSQRWRIEGQLLELFNAEGDSLLVAEAVYLQ